MLAMVFPPTMGLLTSVLLLSLLQVTISQASNSSSCKEDFDVLVLGAGMAGVKAAATLYENGVRNIAVLEQSHRVGGRMWNVPWQKQIIELGANWIEGTPHNESPIWAIGQKIGLKGNYTSQEGSVIQPTLYDSRGRVPSEEATSLHQQLAQVFDRAFNMSCNRRLEKLADISLREALTASGWPPADEQTNLQRTLEFFVVDWDFEYPPEEVSLFNYFSVGHNSSNTTSLSSSIGSCHNASASHRGKLRLQRAHTAIRLGLLKGFGWEVPRYFVTDPRGYAAIADYVAKPLLSQDEQAPCSRPAVLFKKAVVSIRYGENRSGTTGRGVRVETSDGSVYWAKRCIVTFSAGVINAAAQSHSLFHPPLPRWKTDAFAKAQNGIYTKIFLRYSTRFWDNADYVLFADSRRRGYYAVWQDLESHGKFFPAKANLLMVTVVQSDSQRVEKQSKNETIGELQAVLRQMYGQNIPEPTDIYIPKWFSDPFFRGCWSNIAIGANRSDFALMQQETGGLFFAGEATDALYNGFVLGGYNSGQTVAEQVLQAMRAQPFEIIV